MILSVQRITENHWLNIRDDWNRLVEKGGANPLFMSHEWLVAWWETYRLITKGQLTILICTDSKNELVGALPIYFSPARRRGIPIVAATFVGNIWRKNGAFISEHQEILALADQRKEIILELLTDLHKHYRWHELVLPFYQISSTDSTFLDTISKTGALLRLTELNTSYSISLAVGFESYKRRLTYNTRRRMFTYRERLKLEGTIEILDHNPPVSSYWISEINTLMKGRWGRNVLNDLDVIFLTKLSDSSENIKVITKTIALEGQPLSSSLDIRVRKSQFNLLLAFDESLSTKTSPGLVHLGYLIESAANVLIDKYDLLVGPGKQTSYKESICDIKNPVCTLQIIRSPWLKAMYRIWDILFRRQTIIKKENEL